MISSVDSLPFLLSSTVQQVLVEIGEDEDGSNYLYGFVFFLLTVDCNRNWVKLISTPESDCDHICDTVKTYLQLYVTLSKPTCNCIQLSRMLETI